MVEAPLHFIKPREPKPEWLKVRAPGSENYLKLRGIMRDLKLNTVCEDAHCPNIGECWHHGTATFMILGDVCTRACTYCAVAHGKPATLDIDEPRRVGEAVEKMGLKYAVITSVDRDDLADCGAGIYAETIRDIKRRLPDCRVEVLIPDFKGEESSLRTVLDARPDGSIHVRSPHKLEAYPDKITERLVHWAAVAPDRVFIAQRRASGEWRTLTYSETLAQVQGIAQACAMPCT